MTKFIFLLTILIGGFASANLPPTSTLGSGDSSYVTTFKFNFGAIPLSHDGTTATVLTIPVSAGGTGLTSITNRSVLFGASNAISEDNTNIFYNSTTKLLTAKNIQVSNDITLKTSFTGFLKAVAGLVSSQSAISMSQDVTGTLPVGNGGTGQASFTAGSVVFMGSTTLSQDNSRFFYDATNKRLGINTNAPTEAIQISSGGIRAAGNLNSTAVGGVYLGWDGSGNVGRLVGGNSSAAELSLSTTNGGNTFERMRIDYLGKVGIGTTAPISILEVKTQSGDTSAGIEALRLTTGYNTTAGSGGYLSFSNSSDNSTYGRIRVQTESSGNMGMSFLTFNSGLTEKVRISAGGFVGIGTSTPTSALNVRLGALFSGDTSTIATKLGVTTGTSTSAVGVGAYTGGYPMVQGMAFDTTTGSTLLLNPAAGKVGAGAASGLGTPANDMTVSSGLSVGSSYWTTAAPSNGAIVQGNVGIGTSSPTAKLSLAGNLSGGGAQAADISLDTQKWFNIGHSSGYGWLAWFADGNGTNFINTETTVPASVITSTSVGLSFQTAPSNTGIGNVSGLVDRMTILHGGNIGINTTAPITKLHVVGDPITAGTQSSPNGSVILRGHYGSASDGFLAGFGSEKSSGGSIMLYGVTPSTSAVGSYDSSNPYSSYRAAVVAADAVKFYTGGVQTVAIGSPVDITERMRLSNDGNLGIGTAVPRSKLVVSSSNAGALGPKLVVENTGATTIGSSASLEFDVDGNPPDNTPNTRIASILTSTGSFAADLAFSNYTGTDITEHMRVTSQGLVGIKTSSPAYTLQVSGDISATSSVRVGSNTYLTPSLGVTAGGAVYTDGSKLMTTAAGTSGQVLTSNGSSAPTWQTAATAVAGSVIQTVSAVYSTSTSSSSTTLIDTGLTASITPTSASNKILVIVNQAGIYTSTSANKGDLRLQRNGTDITVFFSGAYTASGGETLWGNAGTSYLDSPATTSSVTYKTQMRRVSGSGTFTVQNDSVNSSITLMEIKQ